MNSYKTLVKIASTFLCFISVSTSAFSQNIGFSVSPEVSYRNLVKTDFVPGIDDFIEESNNLSESIIGFTAEAFFVKPFARKLYFETGVSFSRDGYNSFIRDLTPESLLLTGVLNSDDPGFDSTEEIETQDRFLSVGIPLRLAFTSDGSINFHQASKRPLTMISNLLRPTLI